jgi:hypothetical protein
MSLSSYGSYSLPATAICPGCGTMVTLAPEPIYPDSPPAICATCDTEVPDYRRGTSTDEFPSNFPAAQSFTATPEEPVENRRMSRGGLFRSLGGLLAERAEEAVEQAKDRFNSA